MGIVDDSLTVRQNGLQVISDVNLRGHFELRIGHRAGDHRLPHTAFGTIDEQLRGAHKCPGQLSISPDHWQPPRNLLQDF